MHEQEQGWHGLGGEVTRTKAGNMTLFRETIKLHVIVFIVARRRRQAARANRGGSTGTGLHGSVLMAIGLYSGVGFPARRCMA